MRCACAQKGMAVSAKAFWLSHTFLKKGLAAAFFSKFFIAAAEYSLKYSGGVSCRITPCFSVSSLSALPFSLMR